LGNRFLGPSLQEDTILGLVSGFSGCLVSGFSGVLGVEF